MVLGYYDHDLEWPESNPGESEDEMQATLRHHKQFYTNGSKCDLTGDFRKTEVRVSRTKFTQGSNSTILNTQCRMFPREDSN
jgi:hypothetical protein